MTRIALRGKRLDRSTASTQASGFGVQGLDLRERVQTSRSARSRGEPVVLEARDDDVLELRCEGGLIELMTVAEARAVAAARRGTTGDVFELPLAFESSVGRGDPQRVVEEVRQFSVKQLHDRLRASLVQQGAQLGAEAIACLLEREFWHSRKVGLGLKQVDHDADGFVLRPELDLARPAGKPYLLLIHGTFSNASAGFQGFGATEEWKELRREYAGRILAFEHKTLGESPLDNALALVDALPDDAVLHLITHSRGGLIGDLLNLPDQVSEADLAALARLREKRRPSFKLSDLIRESHAAFERSEAEQLRVLGAALAKRKIRVERYVRAAAPARGTVLAARRLDKILKLILNIVGLTPGLAGNPIYGFVEALALATVGIKSDPRALPGLEAMMPDSPFIWLLNQQKVRGPDQLAVIAGDIEGSGIFGRLKVLATDLLYGFVDHDLVVNTESMYEGLRRDGAIVSFQQGPQIAHTSYFGNDVTRARVRNYLLFRQTTGRPRGFVQLPPRGSVVRADNTTRDHQRKSAGVVLVGAQFALALSLSKGNGARARHAPEALDRLIGSLGVAGLLTETGGPVLSSIYDRAIAALSADAELFELPYDLQRSPDEQALEVQKQVESALAKTSGRVSILAHSGGALAVVAWLKRNPAGKQQLRGGHIVLLGPPLHGSFEALRWVLGEGALAQQLEMLDTSKSAREVGEWLASLPGVRALLPARRALPQLDAQLAGVLDASSAKERASIDAALAERLLEGVHCVFGRAPVTTSVPEPLAGAEGAELEAAAAPQGELLPAARAWRGSRAGDGFVLYAPAQSLGGAVAWLAAVDHAGLASDPSIFPALQDLLASGHTSRLRTMASEPDRSSDRLLADMPSLFPTGESLARAALGIPGSQAPGREDPSSLEIVVVNGSLESCAGPIAIGHYTGAPIMGAGAYLDRHLDGALRNYQYLGLYPESAGLSQLVGRAHGRKFYAVVLGLGASGELTPERLSAAMADGALRCALAEAEEKRADAGLRNVDVELNSLLIGTIGRQGLSIPAAVAAIVRGVLRANRALAQKEGDPAQGDSVQRVRITKLTFIERYQDVAEDAASAAWDIEKSLSAELADGVQLQPQRYVLERAEGWRPGRPEQDYEQGAWQSLIIARAAEAQPAAGRDATLTFTYLGRSASVDQNGGIVATQQVQHLIEATVSRHDFGQVNNTIYELLVPQELKDDVASASNLQLVVDPDTAAIPWELMATRDHRGDLIPLSTRVGILRRLKLDDGGGRGDRGRSPMGLHALVIGDPYAGPEYPQLAGAREEARAVEQLLAGARYAVRSIIAREDELAWSEILNAAFERGYRIMHIAAHGDFRADQPEQSGVVIGPGQFLTASTVKQLPVVPELVFLNCCHLARTGEGWFGGDAQSAAERTRRHLNVFAASVSAKLMQIGVRAVVAAGWAVDDLAARAFATSFYADMVGGYAFGDAVTRARVSACKAAPNSNTWGAYQCYGDPAFRLSRERVSEEVERRVVGRAGFERRLKNLIEDTADVRSEPELEQLRLQLARLEQEAPPQWLAHADTRYHLGRAHAELGDYASAVAHYGQAFESNSAGWPAELVEQLANMEVRLAAQRVRSGAATAAGKDTQELLERARKRLDAIISLCPTPERYALLGSYYKKRATTAETKGSIEDAIQRSGQAYYEAWKHKDGGTRTYQISNYLQMTVLLRKPLDQERREQLERCEAQAARLGQASSTFWDRVAPADAALTRLLFETAAGDEDRSKAYEAIAEQYKLALDTRSKVRERNSIIEHLVDLEILFARVGLAVPRKGLRSILDALGVASHGTLFEAPTEDAPSARPARVSS